MSRNQRLVQILVLGSALSMGLRLQAQSAPHSINPAIAQLAARIAQPLQESHAKKIIVADLTGPDGQSHPVGKWLADQLSDSLSRDFPGLNIIARPADQAVAKNGHASDTLASADQSAKAWAHHLGAKVVITGSFAKTADGIAISLAASHSSGSQYMVGDATGIVPISDEITTLSADPIPELNRPAWGESASQLAFSVLRRNTHAKLAPQRCKALWSFTSPSRPMARLQTSPSQDRSSRIWMRRR